ncbi:MAG TPA: flagellar assembly peptidoglycan hydrolase FlgJ [Porticoccus sp.]|nr:flagellar assembly peptidoglycan hydrolase FlgJ [Porticoccus sp.]
MNSTFATTTTASDSYTDLAGLNAITRLGKKDQGQALGEIAKQFESMMVQMMMKSMRSANEVFAEGNFLSSSEGDLYQDMYDDQLSLSISKGRGLGIADVMVRQLRQRFGVEESKTKATDIGDYLNSRNNYSGPIPGAGSAKLKATELQHELSNQSSKLEFDGSTDSFVQQLYRMAEQAANKLGVKPEALIAQAALETGWGKKISSMGDKSSFNLFNIKADKRWQGSTVTIPTLEVRQGVPVKEYAAFRAYDSPQHSFDDYVEFISNSPRYEQALAAGDSESYIRALKAAGYATDPNYADKVLAIMHGKDMKNSIAAVKNTMIKG